MSSTNERPMWQRILLWMAAWVAWVLMALLFLANALVYPVVKKIYNTLTGQAKENEDNLRGVLRAVPRFRGEDKREYTGDSS